MRAREYGLDAPRGILLLGVQGCGKSLCAKVVAADWQIPLLRMDPGVLYQKYIGESENRLREALAQAEAMAPVVSVDRRNREGVRVRGEHVGGRWAVAADVRHAPVMDAGPPLPDLHRRDGERHRGAATGADAQGAIRRGVLRGPARPPARGGTILEIHLRRRNRDPARFALDTIAAATEGFSGAELEQLIVSAMYTAFPKSEELTDAHLLAEKATTKPLSVLMRERIVNCASGRKTGAYRRIEPVARSEGDVEPTYSDCSIHIDSPSLRASGFASRLALVHTNRQNGAARSEAF